MGKDYKIIATLTNSYSTVSPAMQLRVHDCLFDSTVFYSSTGEDYLELSVMLHIATTTFLTNIIYSKQKRGKQNRNKMGNWKSKIAR